ncbi:MAG: vWA domain-containing protein [Candidatus Limnocylindrales bacterium]
MRHRAIAAGRLNVPLIVAALSWLALASPAATAPPTASPSPSASPSAQSGILAVTLVGAVDDSAYPSVTANLSIVDAVTGRSETALDASNVSPSPAAKVTTVSPSTASLPAAYVVVLDTSGSMVNPAADGKTYMVHAKSLAKDFAAGVGPEDLVKLVTFDETTVPKTGWLKGNDPTLGKAIDQVQSEARKTYVSDGLVQAAKIANGRPSGYDRRAVVVITDASPADKDANLSSSTMRQQLGPPTFVVGLLPPAQVGPELTQLLSDVATYTGGSYASADSNQDAAKLFGPVWASARSTWKITFTTDLAPDANSHQEVLTLTDAQQRTGTATLTYRSGGLSLISPLKVENLASGDTVTADRAVTISVGGTKDWKDARIDLFVDCDPAHCSPTLTADNGPLAWRIAVASMSQGSHHAVIRLTTTDDQGTHFSAQTALDFTRSGTTWNVAAVILVGGIGLLAIGAFFIASRRRGKKRNQRRAQ